MVRMDDGNERRRRELEEILELRRSFGTLGRRLVIRQGPIRPGLVPFPKPPAESDADVPPDADQDEPFDAPPAPAADAPRIPDPPAQASRRRLPWPWLAAVAGALAVGLAIGLSAGTAVSPPAPRPAPPVPQPAAATAPSLTTSAQARPHTSVPPSCLATARHGDLVIDLLVKKRRGEQLARELKAYAEASQACREAASTR
jgi:hypothetical protein